MNLKILNSRITDFLKHPHLNSGDFDVFALFIRDRTLLKNISEYLNCQLELVNYKIVLDDIVCRKFISVFLFLKFPKIHHLESNQELGRELLNLAKQIKFQFRSINIYLTRVFQNYDRVEDDSRYESAYLNVLKSFFSKLDKYLRAFDSWKRYDLENLIFQMSLDYHKFQLKLKNPVTKEILPELHSACIVQKNKIINYVKKLDSREGIFKFNEYLNIIKEYDSINDEIAQKIILQKISNTMHGNMMVEKWDTLEAELEHGKFQELKNLLSELKKAIRECVPNLKSLPQELDEIIDNDYIISKIKDDVFYFEDFKKLTEYLFNYLRKFQSPSEDDMTQIFYEELTELLDDFEHNFPFIVRFFLENMYLKFDNIRRQCFLFRDVDS